MVSATFMRRLGAAALILPTGDHIIGPILTMLFAPALAWSVFGPGAVAAVIFFLVLGAYQLACIGILLKTKSTLLLALGIPGNLVSIVIYFTSLNGVTIFGVPPQNGGTFALIIKALEAVFLIATIYSLRVDSRNDIDFAGERNKFN